MTTISLAKLTAEELTKKDGLESTIAKGIESFREVGSCLLEIQQSKLYRDDFVSFEDYLKAKWGISRTRGDRGMVAEAQSQAAKELDQAR